MTRRRSQFSRHARSPKRRSPLAGRRRSDPPPRGPVPGPASQHLAPRGAGQASILQSRARPPGASGSGPPRRLRARRRSASRPGPTGRQGATPARNGRFARVGYPRSWASYERALTSLMSRQSAQRRPRTISSLGVRIMPSGLCVMPSSRWSTYVLVSTSSSSPTRRTLASN